MNDDEMTLEEYGKFSREWDCFLKNTNCRSSDTAALPHRALFFHHGLSYLLFVGNDNNIKNPTGFEGNYEGEPSKRFEVYYDFKVNL